MCGYANVWMSSNLTSSFILSVLRTCCRSIKLCSYSISLVPLPAAADCIIDTAAVPKIFQCPFSPVANPRPSINKLYLRH